MEFGNENTLEKNDKDRFVTESKQNWLKPL